MFPFFHDIRWRGEWKARPSLFAVTIGQRTPAASASFHWESALLILVDAALTKFTIWKIRIVLTIEWFTPLQRMILTDCGVWYNKEGWFDSLYKRPKLNAYHYLDFFVLLLIKGYYRMMGDQLCAYCMEPVAIGELLGWRHTWRPSLLFQWMDFHSEVMHIMGLLGGVF